MGHSLHFWTSIFYLQNLMFLNKNLFLPFSHVHLTVGNFVKIERKSQKEVDGQELTEITNKPGTDYT